MPALRARAGSPPGVVYTPAAIAAPMVRQALAPLVQGRDAAALRALRVCDPAAGEGAFLVEVVAFLGAALLAAGGAATLEAARAIVAAECITGVDLDARALAVAQQATGAPASAFVVADALTHAWGEPFDAVIANPPYVRQESLANKAALQTYASYAGGADLYVYFVELVHRIVRPGGRYCVIVPTKWRTAAYGRGLRAFLAARASIEGIVDLPAGHFTVHAYPCIVWGTIAPATMSTAAPIAAHRAAPHETVEAALAAPGTPHERARWTAEPWHLDGAAERALLDRLERDFPPLHAVVPGKPARGLVTGCNRAFVLDRAARDALLAVEPSAAALIEPFVRGRDLTRYAPPAAERFVLLVERGRDLDLDRWPRVLAHLAAFRTALQPRPSTLAPDAPWAGRKRGNYRWFELQDPVGPMVHARTPRILYQDIQTQPIACLDEAAALVPDTTVWMLPTTDRCILAVLSSPLYAWYARRRFPPALHGAVRPKLPYLRALPVALPTGHARRALVALVDERIAAAAPTAALDAELAERVAAVYRLSAAERALIAARDSP